MCPGVVYTDEEFGTCARTVSTAHLRTSVKDMKDTRNRAIGAIAQCPLPSARSVRNETHHDLDLLAWGGKDVVRAARGVARGIALAQRRCWGSGTGAHGLRVGHVARRRAAAHGARRAAPSTTILTRVRTPMGERLRLMRRRAVRGGEGGAAGECILPNLI